MARRWSSEDIRDLEALAQKYSVQIIAEKMDRSVGGVAFKAHQLGVPVKSRSQINELHTCDAQQPGLERPLGWAPPAQTGRSG